MLLRSRPTALATLSRARPTLGEFPQVFASTARYCRLSERAPLSSRRLGHLCRWLGRLRGGNLPETCSRCARRFPAAPPCSPPA
jgi:hypothetical protein